MNAPRSLLIALIILTTALLAPAFAAQSSSPPELQAQINALAARVSALEGQVTTLQATVSSQAGRITALEAALGTVQASAVMALNSHLTVTTDTRGPLALFSGVNIELVNGTGHNAANGLGNLIIGYDYPRAAGDLSCSDGRYIDQTACEGAGKTWALNHKTGSHYLVIGDLHNYSQDTAIVMGYANTSNNLGGSVIGGAGNVASGFGAIVVNGVGNVASGQYATVLNGDQNTASGWISTTSGGGANQATGNHAAVFGGGSNTAGTGASVTGGERNTANGWDASVSGGSYNAASGYAASVSGGYQRSATGDYDWRAGDYFQDQ